MASLKLVRALAEELDPEMAELFKIKAKDRTRQQTDDLQRLIEDMEVVVDIVEAHQAETQRLLVVGQIQYDGSEEVYTVALGPFGARGKLDTPEKFKKAAEDSTAAHEKGGRLAWDVKTGRGQGRYMVVPLFRTPRDAWDFYRASDDIDPDVIAQNIEASIRGPALDEIYPACVCGVRPESGHQSVMGVKVTRKCYRHLEK